MRWREIPDIVPFGVCTMIDVDEDLQKGGLEVTTSGDSFSAFAPMEVFEKADAPAGQRRRIAGVISTESQDQEEEVILQRGLDFDYFVDKGWYNNNHGKGPDNVLGYPEAVQQFTKGAKLPNGEIAKANLTWAEGFLVEGYAPAERIWELGCALAKGGSKRRLGYSIEGKILRRTGVNNKTIAKAKVQHVAITHCPVNSETSLIALAKSLQAAERADEREERDDATDRESEEKALTSSSGAALIPQSLEQKKKKTTYSAKMCKADAVAWVQSQRPHLSREIAERIVAATVQLSGIGLL